jgi:hypothetical protein
MTPALMALAMLRGQGKSAMQLNDIERSLIAEALQQCAARHEWKARFRPPSAKLHDDKAAAMRRLAQRIEAE